MDYKKLPDEMIKENLIDETFSDNTFSDDATVVINTTKLVDIEIPAIPAIPAIVEVVEIPVVKETTEQKKSYIQLIRSVNLNSMYVNIKTKLVSLLQNNILPLANAIKNNNYGKFLFALVSLLFVVFGYITTAFLQGLYLLNLTINSIRTLKSGDVTTYESIINNWITYSTMCMLFKCIDVVSDMLGNMMSVVFELCKLILLCYLFNSESMATNLNYGMTRFYSCNNRVIDTIQSNTNNVVGYIHQAYDKETINNVMRVVTMYTSKDSLKDVKKE